MQDYQTELETCHAVEHKFASYFDHLPESLRPVMTQVHVTEHAHYIEVEWQGERQCSESDLAAHFGRPVRLMDGLSSGREFVRISR